MVVDREAAEQEVETQSLCLHPGADSHQLW